MKVLPQGEIIVREIIRWKEKQNDSIMLISTRQVFINQIILYFHQISVGTEVVDVNNKNLFQLCLGRVFEADPITLGE